MEHAQHQPTDILQFSAKTQLRHLDYYDVDAEQNIFSFVERNNYDILPSKCEAEDLNHDDTDTS